MKKFTYHLLTLFSLLLFALNNNISAQATVTLPGNFQSELGCTGDWMPECDATRLTETSPGTWEGKFTIPAGDWRFKVTHDNSWNVNYGQFGIQNGEDIPLLLVMETPVHFIYDAYSHIVIISYYTPTVSLVGSFQSELGCAGDWQPDCNIIGLTYDDNMGLWYGIFEIPEGNWEFKVVHDNSWNENYGEGGIQGGANIQITIPADKNVFFKYDPSTHITTFSFIDRNVTLAGDFQSEIGCGEDWLPYCYFSNLYFDQATGTWKGVFTLPEGNWQFKVTINGSWNTNYGEGGTPGGSNYQLNLAVPNKVSFEYDPVTHIVSYLAVPITVVLPGTFQDELGCSTEWDPACDFTRLSYDAVNKVYSGTFDIPAGSYQFKVALNNSWNENYGNYGVPGGDNIDLYLATQSKIEFTYYPLTHIVTIIFKTAGISITKFYDANANGYFDDTITIAGVEFTLLGSNPVTQQTGPDGKASFINLTPNLEYSIAETVPVGFIPTTADTQTVYLFGSQNVYFGNVCLGGAGAKEIGFWMNKHGQAAFENSGYAENILYELRNLSLRNADGTDFDPYSYAALREWLKKANAKNMTYMLSAQLAVHVMNLYSGMVGWDRNIYAPGFGIKGFKNDFIDAYSIIWMTNMHLYNLPTSTGGDESRAMLANIKDILGHANNDLTYVQLQPCSNTINTSGKRPDKVNEDLIASNTRIWPNPSNNYFTLRPTSSLLNSKVEIRVLNINGKEVYINSGPANNDYRFGENFLPGLYFVELIQGGQRTTFKIVKQ